MLLGVSSYPEPPAFANCIAGFDANKDNYVYNDGDAVGTIKDYSVGPSGTPRDLTQATAGNKPTFKKASNGINSRNAYSFDGGDFIQYTTSFGNTSPVTTLIVMRTHSSLTGAQNVMTGLNAASTNGVKMFYVDNTFPAVYAGTARLGTAMSVSTNYFVTTVLNQASSVLRVNGTNNIIATTGTEQVARWTMGRNALNNTDFYFGLIGCVYMFSRALSTLEIQMLELWARRTWGL